jgi:Rrf2 family nitric oxide-sensitive transcriptional repressor
MSCCAADRNSTRIDAHVSGDKKGVATWPALTGAFGRRCRDQLLLLAFVAPGVYVFLQPADPTGRRGLFPMRLTTYSNYALRILMVAAIRRGELVTVHDVAESFGISKAHLVKCVHQLGVWGYLENVRGRSGGFRLAKDAGAITVGEIIRKTEDGLDLVECFDAETNTCPLIDVCRLSTLFKKACQAFLDVLDEVTIADMAANRGEVLAALNNDWAGPTHAPRRLGAL